jgi:hypothetical protein
MMAIQETHELDGDLRLAKAETAEGTLDPKFKGKLISFRNLYGFPHGIDTRSLAAQGEQRRIPLFNIQRGNS